MIRLILTGIACLTLWLAPLVVAAQDNVVADPSANDLHEFTRLLSDARIQNWITAQANDADIANTKHSLTVRNQLVGVLGRTRSRMGDIAQA